MNKKIRIEQTSTNQKSVQTLCHSPLT